MKQDLKYFIFSKSWTLIVVILLPVILPIFILWVAIFFMQYYFTIYKISDQGLVVTEGVFSKRITSLLKTKINDMEMQQTVLQRIFGVSNLIVMTGNDIKFIIKNIDQVKLKEVLTQHKFNDFIILD